jgi:hypothetical protein
LHDGGQVVRNAARTVQRVFRFPFPIHHAAMEKAFRRQPDIFVQRPAGLVGVPIGADFVRLCTVAIEIQV